MTEEMFPAVTMADADRERIRARARLTRDVLADLEEAALSAASHHTHQVDSLKNELAVQREDLQRLHRLNDRRRAVEAELDRLNNLDVLSLQLPDGSVPAGIEEGLRSWYRVAVGRTDAPTAAASMTVGLDDIRTILAEETHTTVQELLVIEDGQVQVVDSLHQLLAHIIAVETAWPASTLASLRESLKWTQEELAKSRAAHHASIKGATDNADADADMWDEEITTLTAKVRALAESIRPVNGAAAEIAARCDVGAAIDVVAQAVTELAGQIVDGGRGEIAQALAREQANANQIENELQAIETICESRGMPATCERVDIPAWLAEQLTARVEKKAKAKRKAKSIPADDIGEGEVGDE
jgi:hypothetical protein